MDRQTDAKGIDPYRPINRLWKPLIFLPLLLLVFSAGLLLYNIATTGEAIEKDIELTGGKLIEIEVGDVNLQELRSSLPYARISLISGVSNSLLVQFPNEMDENLVLQQIGENVNTVGAASFKTVEPALGDIFFQQAQIALIVAFIFMSIVIFILFRSVVPSLAVVLAAVTDIVSTIAVMDLLGIQLSLPVLAALLTLIGYSVDTDILLTSRLIKSGQFAVDELKRRIGLAMKTGLTMSATTLVALTALFIITNSFVLQQIAVILTIGLIIDIFVTWLTNAGILRWWLLRRSEHK